MAQATLTDEPDIFCPDCGKQTLRFHDLASIDSGWVETRVCRSCHNTVRITRYESDPAFKDRVDRYVKAVSARWSEPAPKLPRFDPQAR